MFSFFSTPSEALYSRFHKAYLLSSSSALGCIGFDGDGGDLKTTLIKPVGNPTSYGIKSCGLDRAVC